MELVPASLLRPYAIAASTSRCAELGVVANPVLHRPNSASLSARVTREALSPRVGVSEAAGAHPATQWDALSVPLDGQIPALFVFFNPPFAFRSSPPKIRLQLQYVDFGRGSYSAIEVGDYAFILHSFGSRRCGLCRELAR